MKKEKCIGIILWYFYSTLCYLIFGIAVLYLIVCKELLLQCSFMCIATVGYPYSNCYARVLA